MTRTSKHILKYQTQNKTDYLDRIYSDYKDLLVWYIQLIISGKLPLKKFLSSKLLPNFNNIKHGQWKQVVYKDASEIIRSQIKKLGKKRYKKYKKVYSYFAKKKKQQKFLDKKFSELRLKPILNYVKVEIKHVTLNIDSRLFDIQSGNEFDEFVQLRTPYFENGKRKTTWIRLPIKHHKHSNKFKDWTRKNTIQLRKLKDNFYLNFIYEKEVSLKTKGSSLGLDCGYKKLFVTSDGNIYGKDLKKIYEKISRKKQGSKNFKQTLTERDNRINQTCNLLNLKHIKKLVVEDLKNVKKSSKGKIYKKFNNKLQRWSYVKTLSKLERLCGENGVLFAKVDPSYTSQQCSCCGVIDKKARDGELYLCNSCGVKIDADLNASINILHRGDYNPSTTKNPNFIGFDCYG